MSLQDAQALATLIREASAAGLPRDVLHLGLGTLPAHLRQPHHGMLVREALAPALDAARGRLFALPNGDLFAVSPPGGPQLPAAQQALGALFGGLAEPPPVAMLRLPGAAAALLSAIEAALLREAPAPAAHAGGRFASSDLAALERALAGASVDAYVRRTRVCRLAPGDAVPATLWVNHAVEAGALYAALLPNADPGAAPALHARLRRLLDRRLLAGLGGSRDAASLGAAGLSLRLASLGEPEFLRFDAALGQAGRAQLVLWFEAADVLAEPVTWGFARAFAELRGYRLGLDLPSLEAARLLPGSRTGAALHRLRWAPDLPPPEAALPSALPAATVVLADADRTAAIGWGWAAGIACFEGRVLDSSAAA